jgi:PEP-CTERM motif
MFRLRTYIAGMASAMALGLGLAAATPAAAAGANTLTYIDFVGTCGDCAGYGLGVLTLVNYAGGTATMANFVDFKYASSILNFDIPGTEVYSFEADFGQLPGQAYFELDQATFEGQTVSPFEVSARLPASDSPQGFWSVAPIITEGNGSEFPAGATGGANLDHGGDFRFFVANGPGLPTPPGVPEPAAWTLMILGFGLTGAGLRRRRLTEAAG